MRRWLPRPTLRLRLTLLYGGLFLAAGTVLLVITYELVAHSPASTVHGQFVVARAPLVRQLPPSLLLGTGQFSKPATKSGTIDIRAYQGKVNETFRKLTATQQKQLNNVADNAKVVLQKQQSSQQDALLTRSGIALGIMAIISIGLGWLVAGRALRPVRTMSARARSISEHNLHKRLALKGPDDELKELGDTFDDLLARLESAFESQRQFVANASHELRTPITLERALVEVALADSGATTDTLRGTCQRVLASSERQERMIDALLTLARSQRGLQSREELWLDEVVADALQSIRPDGVRIEAVLGPAPTLGDAALVERLVGNLLDNALRYNFASAGWIRVWTGMRDGLPVLRVANSGEIVRDEEAAALTEPFRRLNGNRIDGRGAGLGLSIVAAIVAAHGAELDVSPGSEGGLEVEVRFPALAPVLAA
ncbi:MAG TPA: ATP-binding protein [Solirubrobacteraceae bacterium]|jgi:signal transduction histidine kinase